MSIVPFKPKTALARPSPVQEPVKSEPVKSEPIEPIEKDEELPEIDEFIYEAKQVKDEIDKLDKQKKKLEKDITGMAYREESKKSKKLTEELSNLYDKEYSLKQDLKAATAKFDAIDRRTLDDILEDDANAIISAFEDIKDHGNAKKFNLIFDDVFEIYNSVEKLKNKSITFLYFI